MQVLGFDLLRPYGLLALAAVPVLLTIGLFALRSRLASLLTVVSSRHLRRFLPGFSAARARWRLGFACAATLFGAIALTGPVRGYTVREVERRGLDIVICIDTSRSMLVRDLRPNRLTRAIREVRGLFDRLHGDRVGLIAFSGDAREIAPLTHDRTTLAALIEQVSPDENLRGGTDLAAALERALEVFDGRTGAHECIVLITDGEDLEARGLDMARRAGERGIRIYVVGMGTADGGKIPEIQPDGSEGFVRDRAGNEVISTLGDESLAEIARVSGGDYLSAGQAATPLEDLYEARIQRLEGRAIESREEFVPHDRYQWFLVLALACMVGEAVLRERGRARAKPSTPLAAWLLVVPGAQQAPAPAGPVGATEESAPAAAEPYAGALSAGRAELRELCARGESEQAAVLGKSLVALAERLSPEDQAGAHYDSGVALADAGQWIGASESFAKARVLAGAGQLRLDAAYNLGTSELELAEVLRSEIPELGGANPAAAPPAAATQASPPAPTGGPGAPAEAGPDFLELADLQYRQAKGSLLERLQMDWRDADTRADLELIQRRLAELEEIRQQREQEEQEQEQEQQQDQKQESDQKEDSQESPDSEPSQEDPQDGEPEDQPPEDQPPEEKPDESRSEGEAEEQPEPQPSEGEAEQEQEPEPQDAEPQSMEERYLTKEEVQRLLEQLRQIDEQARELQMRLRNTRKPPVEKDW